MSATVPKNKSDLLTLFVCGKVARQQKTKHIAGPSEAITKGNATIGVHSLTRLAGTPSIASDMASMGVTLVFDARTHSNIRDRDASSILMLVCESRGLSGAEDTGLSVEGSSLMRDFRLARFEITLVANCEWQRFL